jgi:molecular chaperone DnaK (HSP70)
VKLGIDFGTTRIVTAAADRGNYPVLTFDMREGNADWFPSLVALRGDDRRYGWDAWMVQGEPGWTAVRSLKRILEDAERTPAWRWTASAIR